MSFPTLLPGVVSYHTSWTGPLPNTPELNRLSHQFDVAASSLAIDEKVPTKWGLFTDRSQNLFLIIHSEASVERLRAALAWGSECWALLLNNHNQDFNPEEPETTDHTPEPLGVLLETPPDFLRTKLPEGHNCLIQAVGNLS